LAKVSVLMSETVDFADLNIDFMIWAYFVRKKICWLDGDLNPCPFGIILSIKTPKTLATYRSLLFGFLKMDQLILNLNIIFDLVNI
jgi:hypothetical protein